jgi:hypothetical protein
MARELPGALTAVEWTVKWTVLPVVVIGFLIGCGRSAAHAADGSSPVQGDRALIVVGLAGDDEHEALFRQTAETWHRWLTDSLQFPGDGVRVLLRLKAQ